jgi:23S rRNA pseudouridine1911/1915/1917 synthase
MTNDDEALEPEYELIDLDALEEESGIDEASTGAHEFRPTKEDINERLDKFVAIRLPDLSRAYIQQLIEQGKVTVDGRPRKRTFKMTPGEVIHVDVPAPVVDELEPEDIPLAVVYEDADVLVIDKVAGMVVHPAPGHPSGTLANAVIHHAPEISVAGSNRPGIVHRLDKDTSGLMVVAKTDRARVSLVKQWNARSVSKHYVALVRGVIEPNAATIDVPIGRDPVARNKMAVVPGGREAITHFSVVERFEESTLLDIEIETGRTHQIRVHLAFIGHPVVGDEVYNRSTGDYGGIESLAPRQFLHADRLGFNLPDGTPMIFESELPPDLAAVLAVMRWNGTEPIAEDGDGA